MRKSAAQIFFQMQKSQILHCATKTQMQISAHVTISEMQNSFLSVWKFFVVLWKVFYMCTIFYKNNILFLLINNNLYIITYYKKINKSQLKIHKNNLAICFKKII